MFIISVMAALCSTTASVPQMLGNVSRLSNMTMTLRGLGAVLWCIYGIFVEEYVLVASSLLAVVIELALFIRTNQCRKTIKDPLPIDTVPDPTDAVSNSSVSVERVALP